MRLKFAITDIHGCLDLLRLLVQKCVDCAAQNGDANPLFVFLGDYIDKGPESAGVIAYLRDLERKADIRCLRGNHDQMFIEAIKYSVMDDLSLNAGAFLSTAKSYGFNHPDLDMDLIEAMRNDERVLEDVEWLDALPYSWEDAYRYFVHAGINPYIALDRQPNFDRLWIRDHFLNYIEAPFPKIIVHGHTPHYGDPCFPHNNRINLDTYAYKSGVLTAGLFIDERAETLGFITATRQEIADMQSFA